MFDKEEKELSTYQDYLDELKKERSNSLENDVPYKTSLIGLWAGTTSSVQIPTLNWDYDINGLKVTDTLVFDLGNPKAMKVNVDKLMDILELYVEDIETFTDTEIIAQDYQHLVGTKATISQYMYKKYPKYKVLSTERTDN